MQHLHPRASTRVRWLVPPLALLVTGIAGCTRHAMSSPKDVATYHPSVAAPAAPPASTPFAMIPAEDALTDSQITDAVFRQFGRDPGIDPRRIDVVTMDGIVKLSGTVDDLLSKDRIGRVAETVRGVRAVTNLVRLDVPKRDDRMITSDVSNALHLNAATESLGIVPMSHDGTVTLRGNVGSWQEKQLAERIAKGVRGVTSIDDQIGVTYTALRSDPQMTEDVKSRLHWDTLVDDDNVSTTVEGGEVFLRGRVGSSAERSRAYADAWVTGVRAVDVNGLTVDPALMNRDVRTPSEAHPSDGDIAQAIRDASVYDPRVKSSEIRPEVVAGKVTLRGIVDDAQGKVAAESIARHTVGVTGVVDLIQVKSDKPVTDRERTERIRSALAIDPITDDDDIDVSVKDGVATLRGAVGTNLESSEATQLAGAVSGVASVDSRLTVKHPDLGYAANGLTYDPYVESWTYIPRKALRSDATIGQDIRHQLATTPAVKFDPIAVRVHGGTATLTGTVATWSQRTAATRDAFAGGAAAVDNKLQVR